jgi:hypothetical protein
VLTHLFGSTFSRTVNSCQSQYLVREREGARRRALFPCISVSSRPSCLRSMNTSKDNASLSRVPKRSAGSLNWDLKIADLKKQCEAKELG